MANGINRLFTALALGAAVALAGCGRNEGQKVGEVSTAFHVFGSDKVGVEYFDDPKIDGVTIFVSKSQTGGLSGAVGLAEDKSEISISVRQTGPIKVKEGFKNGEDVFTEKRSAVFKTMHVTRFWSPEKNSVVYLAWSDKLVDGSPKNSNSAVVAGPWLNDDGSVTKADLGPLAPKPVQTLNPR